MALAKLIATGLVVYWAAGLGLAYSCARSYPRNIEEEARIALIWPLWLYWQIGVFLAACLTKDPYHDPDGYEYRREGRKRLRDEWRAKSVWERFKTLKEDGHQSEDESTNDNWIPWAAVWPAALVVVAAFWLVASPLLLFMWSYKWATS